MAKVGRTFFDLNPMTHPEKSPSTSFNPLMFSHNMKEACMVWQDILRIIAQEDGFAEVRHGEMSLWHLSSDVMQLAQNAMADPARLMQLGYVWFNDAAQLWQQSFQKYMDAPTQATPQVAKAPQDKRFADESWEHNALFDYIKQQYLMTASWMQDVVTSLDDGDDQHRKKKLSFYTQQWLDAMAPTNFMITNPEVLKAALDSDGETILRGLENLRKDFERGKGKLAISTTDNKAFELGKNLAATEGKVVFQNELFQLLQYKAVTKTVHDTPLLLIPAWINKFYIFDMQQKNSYVQWLTEQGYSVFVVSWVNPDERLKHKQFEDYMTEGLLKALEVTRAIAGAKQVSCVGYCLGGTLLACTLAYLHAKGQQDIVKSATYLTTMIDFSDPGELGVFIDEEQIQALEAKMDRRGYLDGSEMSTTFSLLRPNNMIWSFVINNYLLGKEPFPFDLLYWNADCTRMPATTHSFYLRNLYLQNKLAKGELVLAGQKIDVTRITTPSYILSTREDHIAPWMSTYQSTQLYSGEITFVLAGSGHIAGVINPPAKKKYGYWLNQKTKGATPQQWLASAKEQEGSWWTHWNAWQKHYSASQKPALDYGNKDYPILEDAPGSYVLVK
jgi:polyhydroxyalkanoate synthase subunit PhaC